MSKTKDLEKKSEDLQKRIEELENRPVPYVPYTYVSPYVPYTSITGDWAASPNRS